MSAVRLLPLAVLAVPGCTAVEFVRPFDVSQFDSAVRLNVTMQAHVRAWLGEPVGTGVIVNEQGARSTRWQYDFGKGR